ncbi:MAG TPA: TonB-dependent receptor [Holophagaceae bacterium]|nr:TonB-dependent receptor [Holophagaceae bacterium]
MRSNPPTLLPVLLVLGWAPVLRAQASVEAFPSLAELAKVRVIVASKNLESTLDSPSSITVFTRAEIRRMGLNSLTDLLNMVPGMQALFEPTEGRDNLLQGRGTPESYGQSFLLLLDGQRLNEHYTGGFTLANRFIALENLERVEIIRGPGSALYGSNAFNGVINLVTARHLNDLTLEAGAFIAGDLNHLTLESGAPSAGRFGLNLSGASGTFAYSAFLQASQDKGYLYEAPFDRYHQQDSTRDPRKGLDALANLEWGKAFLQLRHTQHQLEDFYTFRRLDDGVNSDRNAQSHVRLGTHLELSPQLTGTVALSATRTRWTYEGRLALQGTQPADLLQGSRLIHDAYDATADFAYVLGDIHRLNFGGSHEEAWIPVASTLSNFDPISGAYVGAYQEFPGDAYRFVANKRRDLHGIYVQHQARWSDRWSSTLGLRHDRYNDVGSSTNPRAALIFSPTPQDRLKAMFGTAFRAPGLGDLYDRDAGVTLGNPRLGPIRVRTAEFAYQHQGGGWQAGLTIFDNRATNLLSSVALPSGKTQVENVGSNHNRGYELEGAKEFGEDWLIRVNFTQITHNETLDLPDPNAFVAEDYGAKRFGSLVLNRNFGDWNLNVNAVWRDQIPTLPHDNPIWLANLAVTYHWRPSLRWQLTVLNLLDTDYATTARGGGLGVGPGGVVVREVPQRGRQFKASFSWHF